MRFSNVGRSLILMSVVFIVLAAGVAAREIYVPPPKDAPGDQPSGNTDVVVLNNGDTLSGSVVRTDENGCLILSHRLIGSDIRIPVASARTVNFVSDKSLLQQGKDSVLIINGDSITGTITNLSEENIEVDTGPAGPLSLKRSMVKSVSVGSGGRVILDEDFSGGMGSVVPNSGDWEVRNEALCALKQGSFYASFNVDQTGPMTYEWDMTALGGSQINAGVAIYCSGNDQMYGNDSYYTYLTGNTVYVYRVRNRGTSSVVNKYLRASYPSAKCRIEYDPETGMFSLTINDEIVAEYRDSSPLRKGTFFLLSASQPTSFDNIRIMKGGGRVDAGNEQAGDDDIVFFANGDRTSGIVESIAGGSVVVRTSYGPLKVELDKVDSVVFGSKNMEEPRRRAGDAAVVLANHDRLTVDLSSLDAECLKGYVDYVGLIELKRSAIRSLRFHIYEE